MVWLDYLWLEGDDSNLEHVREHDPTPAEVEHVVEHFVEEAFSRSRGRPMRFGYTPDGRYIAVVFERIDDVTVYPITAFEVGE